MSNKENKVQFNLKNVHYAILTPGDTPTWSAPVKVPGAVTLTLDPSGDVTPFYADGVIFYNSVANNGYTGTLEMAGFPDKMQQEVWKMELGDTGSSGRWQYDQYRIQDAADTECVYFCSAAGRRQSPGQNDSRHSGGDQDRMVYEGV